MLQLRLLQQGLIALLVRVLPPPPVMNQNKISNLENTRPTNNTRRKPVQPRHPPPASTQINRTVLTTTEPKRRKPVQPRHPPQASAQINCTGPTFHTAEPHTERKYDPARQRNLQRLTRPR
jgi:hypothetical protein